MSIRRALVALLLSASIAGCGGASVLPEGGLTADEVPPPAGATTADLPGDKAPVKTAGGGFNPFAEQPAVPQGGR